MTPNRRIVLQTMIVGLSFRPAAAFAQDALPQLPVLARIATGNSRLNPLAEVGGQVLYCGDKTLGVVSAADRVVAWQISHGFDTAAEYRPRVGGAVLVCGGRFWLAGYDIATGQPLWAYPARIQTGVPLVTPTQVIFGDGHEITALDTVTGTVLWRHAAVPDTLASYAPTANADTVFAGPGDGRLYALALTDGSLRWSIDGRKDWQYLRQIQVDGDVLVAGTYKERLIGLSVSDGSSLWSFNAGNFINSQHVRDGSAYLWSPTGWIYAVSTTTGATRWRYQTTDYDHSAENWASVLAELVVMGDQLCALDMRNTLHLLGTATGRDHRAFQVPDRIRHAVLPIPGVGFGFPTETADVLLTAFA